MSIVSTVIEQYPQANGSTHVVERHTDDAGREYMRTWFASPKTDIEARVAEHARELEAELADREQREREAETLRAADEKLAAYIEDQPVEALKTAVKLSDDEVHALKRRAGDASVRAMRG